MLVPDYLAVGAVDLGHRLAGGGGIERALADHPIVAVDLHVHVLERAGPARPVARLQSEATTGRKHLAAPSQSCLVLFVRAVPEAGRPAVDPVELPELVHFLVAGSHPPHADAS